MINRNYIKLYNNLSKMEIQYCEGTKWKCNTPRSEGKYFKVGHHLHFLT